MSVGHFCPLAGNAEPIIDRDSTGRYYGERLLTMILHVLFGVIWLDVIFAVGGATKGG